MPDDISLTSAPTIAGPLGDPFVGWPNSDLLMNDVDRAFFMRHYAEAASIFDWPELRTLFSEYNHAALKARKASRRAGIAVVTLGFISLLAAAMVPVTDELIRYGADLPLYLPAVLGESAASLAVLSLVMGYAMLLNGKKKLRWLTNRFSAERTRQFHFQLIINNLERCADALRGAANMQAWLNFRAQALDQFKHEYLLAVEDKIHDLEMDEAEHRPWVTAEWNTSAAAPTASPEIEALLKLMEKQRFGIQQRYAERKMLDGWHSPETRIQWVSKLSDVLTFALLVATIFVGIASYEEYHHEGAVPIYRAIAVAVAALCSSTVVVMRALKEGLLFSADAERYRWYLATVHVLYRRFENGDLPLKISLLREMERVAYQEMRRFIISISKARFII
jgi:hypothetical protein